MHPSDASHSGHGAQLLRVQVSARPGRASSSGRFISLECQLPLFYCNTGE